MSEAQPLRARRMLHRLELRSPHDFAPRAVSEYQKERFEALRRIGVPGPGAGRKIRTVEVCDSIEIAGPQRHVFDSNHGSGPSSTIRADTKPPATTSSATEIGSLNRRGPALPGFTKTTPSRCSMTGLCEWPDTTTRTPAPFGSISSCAR